MYNIDIDIYLIRRTQNYDNKMITAIIKSLQHYYNVFNVNTLRLPSLQLTYTKANLHHHEKHVNMSNIVTLFYYCHLVAHILEGTASPYRQETSKCTLQPFFP